jgi:hypothetical protein
VGYVWQKNQIYELGQQIKKRETRLSQLHDQNEVLSKQLATLRRPAFLLDRIEKLNLGLGPPQPGQVFRLDEPSRDPARMEVGAQFADRAVIANVAPDGPK